MYSNSVHQSIFFSQLIEMDFKIFLNHQRNAHSRVFFLFFRAESNRNKFFRTIMETHQQQGSKEMPGKVALSFSVLTHALLLAPVLYIVALYFGVYSFFAWHPICMAVGVSTLNKKMKIHNLK